MRLNQLLLLSPLVALICGASLEAAENLSIRHHVAAIQPDKFLGWPANNGIWQWGDEILVGFTRGNFALRNGHNIDGRQDSLLTRSRDGGQTWEMFDPSGFLDDEHPQYLGAGKTELTKPLDFTHPGFALRIFATGYHGNDDPAGGFFYSMDRGQTWHGPHPLNGLAESPELRNARLSPRTDYLVQSDNRCLLFITADDPAAQRRRVACVETADGGRSFQFLSWVTPVFDDARGTMSQTVQLSEREFLLTYRKIQEGTVEKSSIEACRSTDGGRTWQHLSTVKVMQTNSNPPALVKLQDGRLCCAYGDRRTAEIRARYSHDRGLTWGPEFLIRDDFTPLPEDPDSGTRLNADMGYVRLVQRPDGLLVAAYYWATSQHPQQHIAVSIWKP